MPVIELRGIKREYRMESRKSSSGENSEIVVVRALRGLDFFAEAGEFISVMGPSGSGKSTMMNILGCLDKPTEGSYSLDGIETSKSNSDTFAYIRNRKIGFIFQSFNLLARTTALENVELPMYYRRNRKLKVSGNHNAEKRLNSQERRKRAISVLNEVGLGDRMDHYPSQLSGGQQQRVAIARAMANDPAFLLADEPTGNLDTEMSLEIMSLFQELNERGKTIIMVTHEPDLASYSKRIITLRDGEIVSDTEVSNRRNANDDLQNWKNEHKSIADAEME